MVAYSNLRLGKLGVFNHRTKYPAAGQDAGAGRHPPFPLPLAWQALPPCHLQVGEESSPSDRYRCDEKSD